MAEKRTYEQLMIQYAQNQNGAQPKPPIQPIEPTPPYNLPNLNDALTIVDAKLGIDKSNQRDSVLIRNIIAAEILSD
jgi:hypothetical protein